MLSLKSVLIITVCMWVFIAFKMYDIEHINPYRLRQEHALPETRDEEQTMWITYNKRVINKTSLKYMHYKSHHCKEHFYRNTKDNLKTVINYTVVSKIKQQYIDIYKTFQGFVGINSKEYPVVVTASSSKRFTRSLAMIKSVKENLLPLYKEIKFIYFDLGLSEDELSIVKAFCNCEVRPFPFQLYPLFVLELFNYAWKPIVIYLMMREFNFVIWADTSWAFNGNKGATDKFFIKGKEAGILGLRLHNSIPLVFNTKEETFQYLKENPCLFYLSLIDASFIVVWKTQFTWKYIIQPWLACTLTENCMSFLDPHAVLTCRQKHSPHMCHRFDQSVWSMSLQGLFNTNIDIISLNHLPSIGREDRNQEISLQTISTFFYT